MLAAKVSPKVLLFLLMVAATGALLRSPQRSPPQDGGLLALLARLEAQGVPLRCEPVMEDGPLAGGAFLCAVPLSRDRLGRLTRDPDRIGAWRGVVLALPAPAVRDDLFARQLKEWGENARFVGGVVLFGDPTVLAQIARAIE
jgi:hypothetical protein